MKLSKLLVNLLLSVNLSACASYQMSDWRADITLPASEDCYGFHVISGKERRLYADDPRCQKEKIKSIRLTYDNYLILRKDLQINCQLQKCKQITGYFDTLFLALDNSLKLIPDL